MKAAVWNGPYKLAIQDMPRPSAAEGQVLIKTGAVGICGSDREVFEGRFKQAQPPLILGHEGSGTVAEVGPGVRRFKRGDRVIVEALLFCGQCDNCLAGRYNLCINHRVIGMIGWHGEYAEYFVAPEQNCHPLPAAISWEEAGLVDTLAGPVHAVTSVDIPLRGTVAVFGPGPAGLFFCRLAKIRGAGRVYLVGTRDERLAFGQAYGADLVLNSGRQDAVREILKDTGGKGVDLFIEAAGSEKALNDGMKVLRKGGVVLVYGVFGGGPIPVDIQPIQLHEFRVVGINGYPNKYPLTMRLIEEGIVDVKSLVSHRFRLGELPELFGSGFIAQRKDNYTKGVVLF
jgi:threonine dehydrogenase-like Zn-dependent dehydrogenase